MCKNSNNSYSKQINSLFSVRTIAILSVLSNKQSKTNMTFANCTRDQYLYNLKC